MALPRRHAVRFGIAVALTALPLVVLYDAAAAHDGISSSDPASGSVVADPIDTVSIDFGTEIGPETELALIGPDDAELPSTTTVTGTSTAELTFDPIESKGTYVVRYLAPSVTDGHLIVGAISFTYGSPPGPSVVPWVLFGIAAVAILGIGFWFSRRARRASDADDSNDDASSEPVTDLSNPVES